jgi:hypothetical protein
MDSLSASDIQEEISVSTFKQTWKGIFREKNLRQLATTMGLASRRTEWASIRRQG